MLIKLYKKLLKNLFLFKKLLKYQFSDKKLFKNLSLKYKITVNHNKNKNLKNSQ